MGGGRGGYIVGVFDFGEGFDVAALGVEFALPSGDRQLGFSALSVLKGERLADIDSLFHHLIHDLSVPFAKLDGASFQLLGALVGSHQFRARALSHGVETVGTHTSRRRRLVQHTHEFPHVVAL